MFKNSLDANEELERKLGNDEEYYKGNFITISGKIKTKNVQF